MATYEATKGFTVTALDAEMIIQRLPGMLGGTAEDYLLEWGGDNPNLLRLSTEREGVTNADLQAVVSGHRALALNATPNPFTADGVAECTITCAPLDTFDWYIWRGGLVVLSGNNAGDGSVEFSTDTPGTYTVEFRTSDKQSGIAEVIANES